MAELAVGDVAGGVADGIKKKYKAVLISNWITETMHRWGRPQGRGGRSGVAMSPPSAQRPALCAPSITRTNMTTTIAILRSACHPGCRHTCSLSCIQRVGGSISRPGTPCRLHPTLHSSSQRQTLASIFVPLSPPWSSHGHSVTKSASVTDSFVW